MDSARILCVAGLICVALASPLPLRAAAPGADGDNGKLPPSSEGRAAPALPVHHVEKRAAVTVEKEVKIQPIHPNALQDTGELLRLVALLPAKSLQLVRDLTVPILDQSLAVPASLLETALGKRAALDLLLHKKIPPPAEQAPELGPEKMLGVGGQLKHKFLTLEHLLLNPHGLVKTKDISAEPAALEKDLLIKTPLKTVDIKIVAAPDLEALTTTPGPITTTAVPPP
ncbi:uncharacterized protein LOC100901958 [Galendromus occidentalis]|uniref:Uncharacterized protein LOC100901958 n=1 Tax=Galendromus occidentalis TaxID=34638 RepID=A0AAJ6VWH9_9ACAR|nr:uncharacterized protein LOC100901958 [Galendromus occidentalis]